MKALRATTTPRVRPKLSPRAYWLKTLHQWHWLSSALCLVAMLAFAITGITLNHAAQIQAEPKVSTRTATVPAVLLATLKTVPAEHKAALPPALAEWLEQTLSLRLAGQQAEWSEDEIYLALPRPGGDAWLSIDLASGKVTHERTDRGWVAYFNDLHKGRNTGRAWFWFIDVFAAACLVFSLTGLVLLQLHAKHRPSTWPMVTLGLLIPFLLVLFFIH